MEYNPKTYERSLTRFIARQALLVQKLIDEAVSQSVLETERFGVKKGEGEDFFFKDYPGLSRKVDGVLHALTGRMDKVVQSGIEWGWDLANSKNDDMVWKVINSIGSTRVPYDAPERWMQKNLPALEAFEGRRIGGMGLSDRVWNIASGIKGDLELALDIGLGEGASADRLSREVRGFLREPERLYRRVRDEKGVLRLSKSASNYHPGQGVYRSSYKNARRLTATETNMAYRSADYERNQQLDFVLGIEVHLSNNHTCLNEKGEPEPFFDICDELQGRYPADFKFTGWHPLCRCYTTTILPSQEEMVAYIASMDENGHSDYQFSGRVTDMPPQFKEWVANNAERIEAAEGRGKLPYFLRDNPDAWSIKAEEPDKNDRDYEFATALGISKGAPMSYEKADEGRENPHYGEGGGYTVNCQTCTVVHEARRRGFDIEAKPNVNGSVWEEFKKLGLSWRDRFVDDDGKRPSYSDAWVWAFRNKYKQMTAKRTAAFIAEKTAELGRYEVYVKWRGRNSAHVFIAERTTEGFFYHDPQTGKQRTDEWMKEIDGKQTEVVRIDNKRINPKIAFLFLAAQ